MRVKVDKDSDTLYFRLDESVIIDSEEIQPGVILDYNAQNQVVGVEFLHISTRASSNELSSIQFQTA
jgi:uncharacterized protein YuzE